MDIKQQLEMQRVYTAQANGEPPKPVNAAGQSIPASPEDIDDLPKSDVRDLLEAHGVELEHGAKVADMKDALKRVMFTDL